MVLSFHPQLGNATFGMTPINDRQYPMIDHVSLNRRTWLQQAGLIAAGSNLLIADQGFGQTSRSRRSKEEPETPPRVRFDLPETSRWRIGLELTARSECNNVIATFPIPIEWPEQTVKLVSKKIGEPVTGWKTRPAPGGTTQVVISMPRVPAGAKTSTLFDFDVTKTRIVAPTQVDDLVIPKRLPRQLRPYVGTSPYIDSTHRRIKNAFKEVSADKPALAWDYIETMYDYVRDHVNYVNGPIRNASEALRLGEGDCEEMTSLFIALCRNAKIPARMVWVPDHCYPEFYLEDNNGNGTWFPCQAAGTRQFGRIEEYRPVLQKGDSFRVPEKKGKPQRYLTEFFTCEVKGKRDPRPTFILEELNV